ncbi:MAG TPA: hypothetical protein DCS07_00590 [Bdellovibrionales bacterium]|nr:MAG: hypothetical protein A2X97_10770 [Bdellovibrionales bacterium GWA1_52_35]OFZ42789.1 MAG: hypothetical protein A2070_07750 [Bdellovibrionales bacterium GWC1_52_8]HAR41128.1 hypothetical protein [Bdellovibrionales bacterium]HCM38601.1 hypothetical protein [Bdellovibrionales bacterium]
MTLIRNESSVKPRITIYISRAPSQYSHRSYGVRWVHLLKDAEQQLDSLMAKSKAREILAALWKVDIEELLGNGRASLAIFHGDGSTQILRIPMDLQDRCVVADSFHIKPILYWVQRDPQFYLLGLDSRSVRLFSGSASGIKLVHEVTRQEILPDERISRGARMKRSVQDTKKKDLLAFFSSAEKEIRAFIGKNRHPVIVVGVKAHIPVYRSVNRDPDLLTEFITGNPAGWSPQELQTKSTEILGRLFESAKDRILHEYNDAEPRGLATTELTKIIHAAYQGQIRKLMVAHDLNLWGSFKNTPLRLHSQKTGVEDDVLDDLAELVLSRGGKVMTLPVSEMPHFEPAAAILK